jgi:hypothetical protein
MFSQQHTQVSSGGYQISRSLRFNSADSTSLNRTPASAGNRTTWTWSAWVKRSALSALQAIFTAGEDSPNPRGLIEFEAGNTIRVGFNDGASWYLASTSAVFRDPSAWYHVVVALDLTNGTNANRVKLYVNNVLQSFASTPTWPTSNQVFNNTVPHRLGTYYGTTPANYLSSYMTEVNFIDGQALTPSSFGETNAQTGVWQPKAYSGSYGTNGFYLNFSDNSNTTAATLGKDYSGNGNNWTPNNFSVTAGAGNDSLVDSPTSYGTDTGVGGTVRGNYNTWNPLKNPQVAVLTNGNLDLSTAGSTARYGTYTTIGVSTGKWYWEITAGSLSTDGYNIGIVNASKPDTTALNADTNSYIYLDTGAKGYNGTGTAYGATYTAGDVIGVALDLDAGTLVFYKNGTSQGTAFTSIASNTWFPTVADNATGSTTGSSFIANFGQRPFAYTAPSGFKALCTQNLPTPTIGATTATQAGKYFNPVLYTGNGSTLTVTGVGFQPDLVWLKARSSGGSSYTNNVVIDSVRGAGTYGYKNLYTNTTEAEYDPTSGNASVNSLNSDGFVLGGNPNTNYNTMSAVAWNWKANGSGSTNTSGSITSTVSANTTSGFSVVTYTGTGTTGTIGHGLGVAPKLIITKNRGAYDWFTYHEALGNNKYVTLNTTGAAVTDANVWQSSNPTTSVFYVGANLNISSNTYVNYCFAEIAGYSKFGSYTGNGSSDGPFVYCGFRPAYVMIKSSDVGASAWVVFDNKRNTYNVEDKYLLPNSSDAEASLSSIVLDFDSNGFKIRGSQSTVNNSGSTYIFACFAETPFKFSLAR